MSASPPFPLRAGSVLSAVIGQILRLRELPSAAAAIPHLKLFWAGLGGRGREGKGGEGVGISLQQPD